MTFERWLALREPADAAARSTELVERLPPAGRPVIHDLGCGTGSMGRWLGPLLPQPQRWVLYDRDEDLLDVANVPGASVETRQCDITRLGPDDLADATLITASALLDMLNEEELAGLVAACAGAGCPTLFTLSVVGHVEFNPPDPLDQRVAAAFNDHQRRRTLGPDAAAVAAERFRALGCNVIVRPSPWRLGPAHADLAAAWFSGWVAAACEQEPELSAEADGYTRRRMTQLRSGRLEVTVGHADLLALVRSSG